MRSIKYNKIINYMKNDKSDIFDMNEKKIIKRKVIIKKKIIKKISSDKQTDKEDEISETLQPPHPKQRIIKKIKKKVINNTCEESLINKDLYTDTGDIKEKDQSTEEQQFLNSLSAMEKKTYLIAKEHLGTSYNTKRSIGFIKWKEMST